MTTAATTLLQILMVAAVLVLVIRKRLTPRPVRGDARRWRILLILIAIGGYSVVNTTRGAHAVHFTGLHEHPQAALIARQQTGHPGLVSFTLHEADRDASWRLIDGLRLISNTTNIGDSKTMITHPASTTHGRLSDAQRDRAGIAQNLVRVSVGFEDIDDLTADLEQAVDRALDPAAVRHGG